MIMRMWWRVGVIFGCVSSLVSNSPINNVQLQNISNIIDVAIIGSGPAGCSAALQCAHLGLSPVMFEGELPGGLISETNFVENWAGMKRACGMELMADQREQAIKAGAQTSSASIVRLDCSQWPFVLTTNEDTTIRTYAVILATGARPRMLNIAGEKELWGHGVSACAVCDAPLYANKDVIVVGGGDSALEQATHLAQFAQKVTIVARARTLRAALPKQEKITRSSKITPLFNTVITRINGTPETGVTSVDVLNTKTKCVTNLPIDGVFLAIGHIPNTDLCVKQAQLYKDGRIICQDRSQKTSVPGLFAAGDVESEYRQAACAAGAGCAAAIDAYHFLCARDLSPMTLKKLRTKN